MARYKIIYLLLLTCTVYVLAEEAEDRTITLKPPDKLILQKSSPYAKEEPSFLARVKNWFFPAADPVPAETHHGGPQYLPPHQPYQSQPDCNPCNKAPWIPVASNVGHNTLINFVPPSSQYGAPPPPRPSQQYGAPILRPSSQYGAPPPPPPPHYGVPPLPPSPQYGAPPLPPSSQYGAPSLPPSPQYGAPPPSPQYGPPSPSLHYGTPQQFDSPLALHFTPPRSPSGPPPPVFRPRPEKLQPVRNLRPSHTTHLRPVSNDYAPIEMQPPPLVGSYHSLPTPPSANYLQPPPPQPHPSDSYGTPIVGPNADYLRKPEFLPPLEQLSSGSAPIPLPNLSGVPLAPIYNAPDFHQNFDSVPAQGINYEVKSNENVQILPSVKVADFLASVEHPINVIQSPLVEVNVKNENNIAEQQETAPEEFYNGNSKLSENPIVVEDTQTAASFVRNITFEGNKLEQTPKELNSDFIKQLLKIESVSNFTSPPIDYSSWTPSWTPMPTSIVPPPIGPTTWLQPVTTTTKKPKQIQIIVPYVTHPSSKLAPSKPYTTLLPVYSPPGTTEEVWSKFVDDFNLAESKKITATAFTPPTTQVYNIHDLLKDTKEYYSSNKLPYDVISLQNNIDDWTQQSFSKAIRDEKAVPKQIPETFFETTTAAFDHEQAGSNKKETKVHEDIETNLIPKETTTEVPTTQASWDTVKSTVLPDTREKLYIVTPQPYVAHTTTPKTAWSHPPKVGVFPTPKFVVRVDPEDPSQRVKAKEDGPLTVVFSEWPHLINNLQTTTTPRTHHPLLGLMDLSKYTPPPNSTVETIAGHSRVVTVVTPATVTAKPPNV